MTQAQAAAPDAGETKEPISRRAILAKTLEATRSVTVDPESAGEIRRLITQSLFAQVPAYFAVEAVAATLVAGIHLYFRPSSFAMAWLVLSFATIIVRWVHVRRYFEKSRGRDDAARWARVFACGALLSGSIWGVGSLLFFSPDDPFLLIVQIFAVTGLSAIALTGYSAHALSFYCFILPAMIPFGLRLMMEGAVAPKFVAVLLSIWMAVFVYLCHLLSSRYFERTLFLTQAELGAATRRAADLADRANQAKTRFLANVSHEFRTPLNAIIGFSEMLHAGVLGELGHPRYSEYANDIHRSGVHLKQLVDDVLDVSRIEMGRMELSEELVPIGPLLRECERTMRVQFDKANIRLLVAFGADLPAIYGDPLRLRQVVLNLMTNALKFTAANGEVSLTAGLAENGDLMIHVSDTGIGMKTEDIPRAMLPFVQIANPPNKGDYGIGIGLHLVRVLVEAHDGTLMIHSEPGRGTIVTIRFPDRRLVPAHHAGPARSFVATAPQRLGRAPVGGSEIVLARKLADA
jgi:two-component system cell cycle sensor histidine kinase PleC